MPHIRFNWVDIVFVTLLIRICYIAFKNGFLPESFRAFGLVLAFVASFNYYTALSDYLFRHTQLSGAKPDIISFLFLFIFILLIFKILAVGARMLLGSKDIFAPDRYIGLVLGLARGILLSSLIYTLFINGPFEYLSKSTEERSFSGQYVSKVAPSVYTACIKFCPGEKYETPLVKMLNSQ